MTFCPGKPGSNPETDLAFLQKNATNLFSLGVGLYLKKTGHRKCYKLFLLLSCFLSFKNCEYINCTVPKKGNKITKKRQGKAHIFKK